VTAVIATTDKINFYERVFGCGTLARNGKNFDVRCPICMPIDKSKRKLVIRVEDDACHCWTCGFKARSLIPLLIRFGSREQLEEYKTRLNPGVANRYVTGDAPKARLVLPHDVKLLSLASQADPDVRAVLRYVTSRGLSSDDVWCYKLAVSDEFRWRRRVIIPSFDVQGKLNYFVGRAIDLKRKPKYDNPDVDKLQVIFNELNIDWTQRLILCEGPFDVFKCGINATCLLGSELNEESLLFVQIITHKTPIVLALDADVLETKVPKIVKKLQQYDVNVSVVDVSTHKDPGNMTRDEFAEALEHAVVPSWVTNVLNKIDRVSRVNMKL